MDSKTKHTPGEWGVNEFVDFKDGHHVQVSITSNGCPIAELRGSWAGKRANACLISAAPELLECLQQLVDGMVGVEDSDNGVLRRSRAAIAKAAGSL